jgi:hypothetical protein
MAAGDRHYSRTNPSRLARGASHGALARPENLARGESSGAALHPERYTGEKNGFAILDEAQVREIRRRRADGEAGKALASAFGVSACAISAIVRMRNWKHVI